MSPMMLTATASDNVGVVRVEAYKDLELVASLSTPPYRFTVTAAPAERFYVTVEALDAAGNRTTVTRSLVAATPPAGDDGVGVPPGDMAVAQAQPTTGGGCTLAGAPSLPWPWIFALAALALRATRRSSGSGSSSRRRR
jgi:hypothetical protein